MKRSNGRDRVLTNTELSPFHKAANNYRRISRLYLEGKIDDTTYAAARSEWEQSQKDFDEFMGIVG